MWDTVSEKNRVISYVDDILIATVTEEENLRVLNMVLDKVKTTGFIINSAKAQMVRQKVTYWGMELEACGRKPDVQWIKLICKLPAPQDI